MKNKIEAVICDFGGVISQPQNIELFEEMRRLTGIDSGAFKASYRKYRHEFDRGDITSSEYWGMIFRDNDLKADPDKIIKLLDLDIKSWTFINTDMLLFLEKIKMNNSKLAILSNMPGEILIFMKKNFSWLDIFDKSVFSCDHRVCKPEKKIFELCTDELNVLPQNCLFIDDLAENISGAESAGLNVLHFKTFADFEKKARGILGLRD